MVKVILALWVVVLAGCANIKNNPPAKPEQIKRDWIKDYPGLTKEELFPKIIRGLGLTFRSAKTVIDVSDKDAGSIVGKAYTDLTTTCSGGIYSNLAIGVRYTFVITVKDGKAKYEYIPYIEKIGLMGENELKQYEEVQQVVENSECFWNAMRPYFEKVTDEISDEVLKDEKF